MNQTSLDFAATRRDLGIARSERSAGQAWQDRAIGCVKEFVCNTREPFMCEDARAFAELFCFLPSPPDGRAWGAVMQRARRECVIKACGYAPANSSNRSPKVQWRAV